MGSGPWHRVGAIVQGCDGSGACGKKLRSSLYTLCCRSGDKSISRQGAEVLAHIGVIAPSSRYLGIVSKPTAHMCDIRTVSVALSLSTRRERFLSRQAIGEIISLPPAHAYLYLLETHLRLSRCVSKHPTRARVPGSWPCRHPLRAALASVVVGLPVGLLRWGVVFGADGMG